MKANPDSLRKSVRDMPDPPQIVQTFIAAFVNAWPVGDATALGTFFDEEAVYHNVPLDPVVGRDAIVATFEQFMSMGGGVAVDIIHMVAAGPIVMTERIDHFTREDGSTLSLPLMGVIEFHHGRIAAWRDYFDLGRLTSQLSG